MMFIYLSFMLVHLCFSRFNNKHESYNKIQNAADLAYIINK